MGVVTPLGHDVDAFVTALVAGTSGVGPITLFDPGALATRIAAEVRDLPDEDAPLPDRKIALALAAARRACVAAFAAARAPAGGGVSLGVGLELFDMRDLAAGWASPRRARPLRRSRAASIR